MKKSFPMLVVVLMLGACASQPVPQEASNSLIDFADIANEITVNYQSLDGSLDGSLDDEPKVRTAKIKESNDGVALGL